MHPGKLTWNPKKEVWKIIFMFKGVFFRFHGKFQGEYMDSSWDFLVKLYPRETRNLPTSRYLGSPTFSISAAWIRFLFLSLFQGIL